jgi:hypothetical protein
LATLAGASTSAVTRFITLIWALDTARLASVAGSLGPATYSEQNDLEGRQT